MDHTQAIISGMSKQWQKERAETQMTLGKMIKVLETMPDTAEIEGLGELDSYRGYYSDLAFEPQPGKRPASEVLADCRVAMGKVFVGYKGGNYLMGETTPLWLANYGMCGQKIISINADGVIETSDDD